MILFELSHTSHTLAATGIQQVCRNLFAEAGKIAPGAALVRDPWQKSWRIASRGENARALPSEGGGIARRKGEAWRFSEKVRGRLKWFAGIRGPLPKDAEAVIFPEFTMQRCLDALPELRAALPDNVPVVAVFHDAIALRMPEISAKATVERFPRYIEALARFDAVAAVSETSRAELAALWNHRGIVSVPPLVSIPLGVAIPRLEAAPVPRRPGASIRVLCISTLEPRKNHAALLDAAESLWREGLGFHLELVGMEHRQLGGPIVAKIRAMQGAGLPLEWHGTVDEATLHALYAGCDFTIYPSLMEGFGLPVLESLAHKKPCVTSPCGALGEVARGGGCLILEGTSAHEVADGLRAMLREEGLLEHLSAEASARPIRSWADYARDIVAFARSTTRRW